MPIPVVCPSCGNNISAPDHVAGRTLRCYKCLNPFTVPNVSPTPAPAAPMAQLAPSFEMPPAFGGPADVPMPPADVPMPPSSPATGTGPDPFELTEEQPAWDAPAPSTPPEELSSTQQMPQEELPSTQDMPLEEAPMELSPADELEAPVEEAPAEEVVEESAGPRKSRKVAALLAILPFSIHRFYLGYTKSAILQILLYFVLIGWVWQVFDFLRLLFGVGFKKDGRGVPLR